MKQSKFFNSEDFNIKVQESINRDTWDKGLPKYYKDKEGRIVEHFKDGKINIIKQIDGVK